jgi:hypothetical protein
VAEKLARCNLKSPVAPIVTRTSLQLLWPQPQRMQELAGPNFVPGDTVHVMVHPSSEPILKWATLEKYDCTKTLFYSLVGFWMFGKEAELLSSPLVLL